MKTYNELYGADADGNRGVCVKGCQIEDSDIVEQLYEDFVNGTETGIRTVFLIDDKTEEDIELEVEIEDYLAELVKKAREDESLKEDEEIQEWLKTFK